MTTHRKGFLSEFFDGYAFKKLTAVEVDPSRSHQHEFQGVHQLKQILGETSENIKYKCKFLWMDGDGESEWVDSFVTWSDVRRKNVNRSAEYHLYYSADAEEIVFKSKPGDLFILCTRKSGELLIIITPSGGSTEKQLSWLFNFEPGKQLELKAIGINDKNDSEVNYCAHYILNEIGIDSIRVDDNYLELIIDKFGEEFPTTAVFSKFAQDTLKEASVEDDPDQVLIEWLVHEEMLFKTFESYIVGKRLESGFYNEKGSDIDGFISYSLSVHQRRKVRAGYALENHLDFIFSYRNIHYDRGAITEQKKKPDFLFPSSYAYKDSSFPDKSLTILGVKTTCKDRWRQVLNEASRIENKHLLTLEPGVSENQTNEMMESKLQLVVPSEIHSSYTQKQQKWLYTLGDFISFIQEKQN